MRDHRKGRKGKKRMEIKRALKKKIKIGAEHRKKE